MVWRVGKRTVEGFPEALRAGRAVAGDEFSKNRLVCEVILSGNSLQNLLNHFRVYELMLRGVWHGVTFSCRVSE